MRRSADKIIAQYEANNQALSAGGTYDMDAMNNQAFDTYNKEALVPCENCGRTFLPDRLIVHQRSCKPKDGSSSKPSKPAAAFGGGSANNFGGSGSGFGEKKSPAKGMGMRPRMLVCPLCGREFGTASLSIHMKTCRQKFALEQQNLPKNMRRSADKIIEQYEANNQALSAGGNYDMDAINNQAFDTYNTQALVPCENCGRTFLPDRLIVHQRSCKKK